MHRLELIRLAVPLVGDRETAEDAVQDVFARLHGKPAHVLTLPQICTCVLNASRSVLRRRAVATGALTTSVVLLDQQIADGRATVSAS